MSTTPTNNDDIIDSRDVIARLDELKGELDELNDAIADAVDADAESAATEALQEWNNDNGDELAALQALNDEAEGYAADWTHGEQLIRDSYFEDYAQELAEDCGMINSDATWPNDCIDWERAARELQMDYTSVDFDGVTYWVR